METGIKHIKSTIVTKENCAKTLGSGTLEVFATPAMIALMEGCCMESVSSSLSKGESTVGISIDVKHLSPSPIGVEIRCESELTQIDGRILEFTIKVFDNKGLIGEGVHKRCIIDIDRFLMKTNSKLSQ